MGNKLKKYDKFTKGTDDEGFKELHKALSATDPETEGLIPETFEYWRLFDNPYFEKGFKSLLKKWAKIFGRTVH